MNNITLYSKGNDGNYYQYKNFDVISLAVQPNSKDESKIQVNWKLYSLEDLAFPTNLEDLFKTEWGIYFSIKNLDYKILNCKLEKVTLGPDINSLPKLIYLGSGNLPTLR